MLAHYKLKWFILMKSLRLRLFLLLFSMSSTLFSQETEFEFPKKKYLKISIYPLVWAVAKNNLWITTHYEGQIIKKFSYNIVFDYYNWTYRQYTGSTASTVRNNQIFYFRPQIRYYLSNKIYRGYYIGLFPLYSYQEIRYEGKYANYLGLGIITGYQFFIKEKYPIEINVWFATHYGKYNQINSTTGFDESGWERYGQLSFELNLGFPLKSRSSTTNSK